MLPLNEILAVEFFKRLEEKNWVTQKKLANASRTLTSRACKHFNFQCDLPLTKKNEWVLYVCVCSWRNHVGAFSGFNLCACKLFCQQRSLRVKWTIASSFKEDRNFIMDREMHIEKHTSSKAPRQPIRAVPLLQIFVAPYIEN